MEPACQGEGGSLRRWGKRWGRERRERRNSPALPSPSKETGTSFSAETDQTDPDSRSLGTADGGERHTLKSRQLSVHPSLCPETPGAICYLDLEQLGCSRPGGQLEDSFLEKLTSPREKTYRCWNFDPPPKNKQVSAWLLCREAQQALAPNSERPRSTTHRLPRVPRVEKIISKPTNTNFPLCSSFRKILRKHYIWNNHCSTAPVREQAELVLSASSLQWVLKTVLLLKKGLHQLQIINVIHIVVDLWLM